MHFHCSSCHQRLAIEDDRAGESLACPVCAGLICVPQSPSAIYKGRRRRTGGVRLVSVPASDRVWRKRTLAARLTEMRPVPSTQAPMVL